MSPQWKFYNHWVGIVDTVCMSSYDEWSFQLKAPHIFYTTILYFFYIFCIYITQTFICIMCVEYVKEMNSMNCAKQIYANQVLKKIWCNTWKHALAIWINAFQNQNPLL
jgi:hypothetical protein